MNMYLSFEGHTSALDTGITINADIQNNYFRFITNDQKIKFKAEILFCNVTCTFFVGRRNIIS